MDSPSRAAIIAAVLIVVFIIIVVVVVLVVETEKDIQRLHKPTKGGMAVYGTSFATLSHAPIGAVGLLERTAAQQQPFDFRPRAAYGGSFARLV